MRERLGDLRVERVEDEGALWLRLPGGSVLRLFVQAELVPFYRRLVDVDEGYDGWDHDDAE